MRKKTILSLDNFAQNNHLSSNKLSVIKGGRKKMSSSKSAFNNVNNNGRLGG